MSDPKSDPNNYVTLWAAVAGGMLSAIGGFFAVVMRGRMDKRAEIDYIKTALIDELSEICSIIDKLAETCKATHIIANNYFTDLEFNNQSFNYHKLRLFLIKKAEIRKGISTFYKELSELTNDSKNRVGQLGISEAARNEQNDAIAVKFGKIKTDAEALMKELKVYKYKVFYWI